MTTRHLLSTMDLSRSDATDILDEAERFARGDLDLRLAGLGPKMRLEFGEQLARTPAAAFVAGLQRMHDADEVLVADHPLTAIELVEDELLLTLPFAPMHEPGACAAGNG